MASAPRLASAHATVVALLAEARDLVLVRADDVAPPWAVSRGWHDYLLGLDEAELERADGGGIATWFAGDARCPPSLRELARRTLAVHALVAPPPRLPRPEPIPSLNPRKRGQVAALVHVLRERFADVSEIVDVGAGRGHVTARAASALAVPAVGLERDPERVAVARALAGDRPLRFIAADVLAPPDNPLAALVPGPNRLVMALHGCGELGDAVVRAAVATHAKVLLLACCPQKIRDAERAPLTPGGPSFPREVLGLANVLPRTAGIEGELRHTLATKEARLALRYLLAARACAVPPGEEMRGVNRRKAGAGVATFAAAVCRARGFAEPSQAELAAAASRARDHYLAQRRFSLPRSMLGRALELFIALDRAAFLAAHGYHAEVVQLFPAALSPRNLAVLGFPHPPG